MFPGGDWKTFLWSADERRECKGRTQSEEGPPNRYEAVSLSTSKSISATPYRNIVQVEHMSSEKYQPSTWSQSLNK